MCITQDRRFLCDEMLARLGRWLRVAGYDTAIAEPGRGDRDLVEQAQAENRLLVTRDRHLVAIRSASERTLVLKSEGVDACAAELASRLHLDWNHDPLSRCTLCNAVLEVAKHNCVAGLPPAIRERKLVVRVCPRCRRLYWEGSHVRRMRTRLAAFSRGCRTASDPLAAVFKVD